jgi:hypothetical protein
VEFVEQHVFFYFVLVCFDSKFKHGRHKKPFNKLNPKTDPPSPPRRARCTGADPARGWAAGGSGQS